MSENDSGHNSSVKSNQAHHDVSEVNNVGNTDEVTNVDLQEHDPEVSVDDSDVETQSKGMTLRPRKNIKKPARYMSVMEGNKMSNKVTSDREKVGTEVLDRVEILSKLLDILKNS